MKSRYVAETEQHAHHFIKRWSTFIIIIELVLGVVIGILYRFDHDEETLDIVKRFITNEYEVCYSYRDELLTMCEQCDSVSGLIKAYNSNRFDLEVNIQDRGINSSELSNSVYNELLPDDINSANDFIRPWIYTWAISDVRTNLNTELEDYYEIQYSLLMELRLHEPYLLNNAIGWLYSNINNVVSFIIIFEVLLLSLGISVIIYYYYAYIQMCRRNTNGGI